MRWLLMSNNNICNKIRSRCFSCNGAWQFIPKGHTVARNVGTRFTVCPLGIASAGRGGELLSIRLFAQKFPSESLIASVGLGRSNTYDNRVPIILLREAIT